MTLLVLYAPVIHAGYIELYKHYGTVVDRVCVLGNTLIQELLPLHQEIRAVDPVIMSKLIAATGYCNDVTVLEGSNIHAAVQQSRQILMIDDAVSHKLAEEHFPIHDVEFLSVFLRWDESNVYSATPAGYDRISVDEHDRELMRQAIEEAKHSGDWWRQIGALIARDGHVLIRAHNKHVPTEQTSYIEGDPRDFITAGTASEINTTLHAEQCLITEAARSGTSLENSSLYVRVFPCPMCAKQVAYSGIRKVFFATGHASLDGEAVLRSQGVELVLVQ
jgi:dCMP deaminase